MGAGWDALTKGWFNYGMADDAKKNPVKYGMPAPASPDLPGDKHSRQADITEAWRKTGGPDGLSAFMMGLNSTVASGPISSRIAPGAAAMASGGDGVDEEQMRKLNYAAHELSPGWHTAGMVAGAVPAAIDYGITGVSALGAGMKALTLGSKAPLTGIGPSAPGYLARLANFSPMTASLGTLVAGGLGGGKLASTYIDANDQASAATKEQALAQYAKEHPDYAAAQAAYDRSLKTPVGLNASEAARPSAVAVNGMYLPDGKLAPGVTPEQAAAAREWATYEAKGLAGQTPDGQRDGSMYAPSLFGVIPTAGQPAQAANGAPAPAGDAAPASPVAAAAAQARSLDDMFAEYEAQYPDNKEGPLSSKQYAQIKQAAAADRKQRENDAYVAKAAVIAKQLNTSPEFVMAMDQSGGLTNKAIMDMVQAQQGFPRTPRVPTPKDLAYVYAMGELDLAEQEAMTKLPPAERDAAVADIRRKRGELNRSILISNPLENIIAAGMQQDQGQ